MDDYDEFGNYIGSALNSQGSIYITEAPSAEGISYETLGRVEDDFEVKTSSFNEVVLHEDKKYYPSADELFGDNVEICVQEEDTQMLSEPIIPQVLSKKKQAQEKTIPSSTFMHYLSKNTKMIRNVAVIGHLHHGKTSLLDCLLEHMDEFSNYFREGARFDVRYTDTSVIERERGISTKAKPISLILPNHKGKSFLFNIMDTPGHVDFIDEVSASLRYVDGAILVVDAAEGVTSNSERYIRLLVQENIPFILFLNKLDRLILELKLPPTDVYFKLRHIIDYVNNITRSCSSNPEVWRVSPTSGSVCFGSTLFGFVFSLDSFALKYNEIWGAHVSVKDLATRLWGDIYFDTEKKRFSRNKMDAQQVRSFVQFVLEPIYKMYTQVLDDGSIEIIELMKSFNVHADRKHLKGNTLSDLKYLFRKFFNDFSSLAEQCITCLPNPGANGPVKGKRLYSGPQDTHVYQAICDCNPEGPLVIHTTKSYPAEDGKTFFVLGRVFSGTLKRGQRVRVLGENYCINDQEDMSVQVAANLWISETRFNIPIDEIGAGNWVLISGVDDTISKTATIVQDIFPNNEDAFIFRPLTHVSKSVIKISVEPMITTELPKLLSALRYSNKTYPSLLTKVEESGEHVLFGPGELYLDCVMHDVRHTFSNIEVKVSDPSVQFCETVVETSSIKTFAETANKRNKITMIVEPLERGISEDIEQNIIPFNASVKERATFFQEKYSWDILASRGIWAFGPDANGPNMLLDDCLPGEVDKNLVRSVKGSIVQGFQWSTREGPLCEEPMRNVKFRILDLSLAQESIYRGGGQLIPTARRVCYSSFLTASPRIMEPIFKVDIQAPSDCISAIYAILSRRRGHVTQDYPISGSPLYCIKALIPVIDSFGFETDIRIHTQGQAFSQSYFDHWQVVPGDPLDQSIVLRPLEPSPAQHLARDFLLKTRRRKGLNEDISIGKFFDDPILLQLVHEGLFNSNKTLI